MEFYENGWVDKISLNQSQLKEIIKFMDAVIIKLEGGTDSDLKYLEEEYASAIVLPEEINILDHNLNSKQLANNSTNNHISNLTINGCNDIGDDDMEDIDRLDFEIEGEQQPLGEGVVVKTGNDKRNDVTSKNDMDKEKVHGKGTKSHKNKTKKSCCSSISRSSSCCSGSSRSSRSGSSSGSSSRSGSSSSSGHSSANSKKKLSEKAIATEGVNKSPIEEGEAKDDDEDKKIMVPNITDESSPKPFHKTTSIFLRNLPPNITKTEIENLCKSYNGYLRVALADPLPERKFYRRGWVTFNNKDANVKEICSTLATIKIRDCEMGPIVNRDITRRVRLVNGIVVHKPLAKSDVRLSLKIVVSLDKKYNLWNNEETTNKETSLEKEPQNDLNIANSISSDPFEIDEELADIMNMMDKSLLEQPEVLKKIIMKVKNPIIKSIVEELMKISLVPVDEIPLVDDKNEINDDSVIKTLPINDVIRSVDHKDATPNNDFDQDHTECDKNKETLECDKNKEDKTGKDNEIETNVNSVEKIVTLVEKDENINKLLDKLILYLRVVHSLDYYSVSEYPNEDDMPNKCGIIHCRGSLSQTKILSKDIQDWLKNFENKIQTFLSSNNHVTKEEASLLGFKDYETEVEKFVQENTQELSKDKWLCPLSGKKFKGPDFVRKHIFNKHHDKVEQVKKEVDFFNNYLLDPKRPHNIDILGYVSSSNAIIANNSANSTTNNVNAKLPTKPFNNFHPYPPNQPHIYQDYPGKNYYYPPPPYSARPGIDSFERNQFMKRKGPGMQREIIQYRDLDAPEDNETLY
ncbi:serrate RNA effector molecule homolog isoform X2 [Gordionus sp. m RMFG-2023]